jgi:hypothetical protein
MRLERFGSSGTGIEIRPNGEFVARGLIPGDYAVQARVPSFGTHDDREPEMASVPFRIDSSDVQGLVVVTRKAARVTGRVRFEDAGASPVVDSLRIMAVPDHAGPPTGGAATECTGWSGLTFELDGCSAARRSW